MPSRDNCAGWLNLRRLGRSSGGKLGNGLICLLPNPRIGVDFHTVHGCHYDGGVGAHLAEATDAGDSHRWRGVLTGG